MRRPPLVLLLLLLLLLARSAQAAPCAPFSGAVPALSARGADERLAFLVERLHHDARDARIWAWTWAGIYSALTTYEAITFAFADADRVIDSSVGVAGAAVGVIAIAALPPKILGDQRRFDRRLAASPDEDRCALVAEAERLLLRDAADEELGHGPLIHAGNFLFNIGLGVVLLGIGFDHWDQAAITMLVGIAVGELQVITRPWDAKETLERYRAGDLRRAKGDKTSFRILPSFGRDHAAIAVGLDF